MSQRLLLPLPEPRLLPRERRRRFDTMRDDYVPPKYKWRPSKCGPTLRSRRLLTPFRTQISDYLTRSEIWASGLPSEWVISHAKFTEAVERKLTDRLLNCGKLYTWACPDCDYQEPRPLPCRLRICPKCRERRMRDIYMKYYPALFQFRRARFMTLTWREHTHRLDRDVVRDINRSWKVLVKRINRGYARPGCPGHRVFPYHIGRYLKVLEIKHQLTGEWFYHLHIIYEGSLIDHADLMMFWHSASAFTSYVVDITSVSDVTHVARYLLKYLNKSVNFECSALEYAELYGVQFYSPHNLPVPIFSLKGGPSLCPNCHVRLRFIGAYLNMPVPIELCLSFTSTIVMRHLPRYRSWASTASLPRFPQYTCGVRNPTSLTTSILHDLRGVVAKT